MQEYFEALPRRGGPHAALVQEHHLLSEQAVAEGQRWLKGRGWSSIWAPAVVKDVGPSAGVAVVVRSHLGLTKVPGKEAVVSPGRCVAGFLPNFAGGGLIIMSVYLHTHVGWTDDNHAIVGSMVSYVSDVACPWLWGGDQNMPPRIFSKCGADQQSDDGRENWIARLNAVLVAPNVPTCWSSGDGACYDYFVMQSSLAHSLVGVSVVDGSSIATHKPVELHLCKGRRPLRSRVRIKARPLPEIPIGCAPKPANWKAVRAHIAQAVGEQSLDQAWASTLGHIELELLNRCDVPEDERHLNTGRADGVHYREVWLQAPARGARADQDQVQRLDPEARAWQVLRRWAIELVRLMNGLAAQTDLSNDKVGRKLDNIYQLRRKVALSSALSLVDSPVVADLFCDDIPSNWRQLVVALYRTAETHAKRCRRAGLARWAQWAKEVLALPGAGQAHRYTKAVVHQQAVDSVLDAWGQRVGDPLHIADQALADWRAVWEHHGGDGGSHPVPARRGAAPTHHAE